MVAFRAPHGQRSRSIRVARSERGALEIALLTLAWLGFFVPLEWAVTPEERARGLMFRESMAADHGMIFDFGSDRPVAFWMKNTPLSLDMIFIRDDGVVDSIAHDTTPFSEASVPSGGPGAEDAGPAGGAGFLRISS